MAPLAMEWRWLFKNFQEYEDFYSKERGIINVTILGMGWLVYMQQNQQVNMEFELNSKMKELVQKV